jgi:hypothetical protein
MVYACGSSSKTDDLKELIVGKYVLQDENEFDHIRDTLEIKPNDQATFDIIRIRWTSAKKDDPNRPVNKIAGQWGSGGPKTVVGTLQTSDTTIRIPEPITGRLRIISFNFATNTLKDLSFSGSESIYHKIQK